MPSAPQSAAETILKWIHILSPETAVKDATNGLKSKM